MSGYFEMTVSNALSTEMMLVRVNTALSLWTSDSEVETRFITQTSGPTEDISTHFVDFGSVWTVRQAIQGGNLDIP